MNITSRLWVFTSLLGVLAIYLFVSAPQSLPDHQNQSKQIPTKLVLEILQKENEVVREIYTREIVGEGKKRGLKFDENWSEENVHAGPLPAQFLREVARVMERKRLDLGLYLVSDQAINQANIVEGQQLERLKKVRQSGEAQMFYVESAQRYAYMFPDVANVKACVECHNDHADSPKKNWKINEVMGAVTWMYPRETVSYEEMFSLLFEFRRAVGEVYQVVLSELAGMNEPPVIGKAWPKEGGFLPERHVFEKAVFSRNSFATLQQLSQFLAPAEQSPVFVDNS